MSPRLALKSRNGRRQVMTPRIMSKPRLTSREMMKPNIEDYEILAVSKRINTSQARSRKHKGKASNIFSLTQGDYLTRPHTSRVGGLQNRVGKFKSSPIGLAR